MPNTKYISYDDDFVIWGIGDTYDDCVSDTNNTISSFDNDDKPDHSELTYRRATKRLLESVDDFGGDMVTWTVKKNGQADLVIDEDS